MIKKSLSVIAALSFMLTSVAAPFGESGTDIPGSIKASASEISDLFTQQKEIKTDYIGTDEWMSRLNEVANNENLIGESVPTGSLTRDYAAHTANLVMGYLNNAEEYSFTDVADCEYPADAQIAVDMGWLELSDGTFDPGGYVTVDEADAILDTARKVLASSVPQKEHENVYEFADYVEEIPDGTDVSFNDDGTISIVSLQQDINVGDVFAVYSYSIPCIYTAEAVSTDGDVTTIAASRYDKSDAITHSDAQEVISLDMADFVPADDLDEQLDFLKKPEFGAPDQAPLKELGDTSYTFDVGKDHLKISKKIDIIKGISASSEINLTDLKLNHVSNDSEESVSITGNAELSFEASADALDMIDDTMKNITIGYFNVGGIGNVTLTLNVGFEGKVTSKYAYTFEAGVSIDPSMNVRLIKSLKRTSHTLEIEATVKVGVTLAYNIELLALNGKVGISVGLCIQRKAIIYDDGKLPATCYTKSCYLYANVTAEVSANCFGKKVSFLKKKIDIYNASNSPYKTVEHIEDGARVSKCTRGLDIESQCAWCDCAYGPSFGVNGEYGASAAEPYMYFSYQALTDSETACTITGYEGNVDKVEIPEKLDGYTVVSISDEAFKGNTSFTSLTMPDTITSIGKSAFEGCSRLKSVTISMSLQELWNKAFANCTSLASVNIPKSLTTIHLPYTNFGVYDYINNNEGPFTGCSALKSVSFEKGIRKIPDDLFCYGTGLEEVTIPDTVLEIGYGAFYKNKSLKKLVISESVTKIGEAAFSGCSSLSDVTFSDSLDEIGSTAFWGAGFTSIDLPDSITTIGSGAFMDCASAKSLHLPKWLKTLGGAAFAGCTELTSVVIPKKLTTVEPTYTFYNGWTTTWRLTGVFNKCTSLKNASFENGTKVVYAHLFENCPGLERVTFPNTVTEIQYRSFTNCEKLDKVTLPPALVSIGTDHYSEGDGAFENCKSLSEITIPDSVNDMGGFTFSGCTSLKKAVLSKSVELYQQKCIAAKTFRNCTSLTDVTIPDNIQVIRNNAFAGCTSLASIKLPKALVTLAADAFYNCSALTEVTLPDKVNEIDEGAYAGCTSLEKFTMPDSVTIIEKELFKNCESLTEVKLSDNISEIPANTFENCYLLAALEVPYSAKSIGNNAFKNTTKFKNIYFCSSVMSKISDSAFSYPQKLTIHGIAGTYVQTYADENDITFVADAKVPIFEADIEMPVVVKYTGKPVTPSVKVSYNGKALKLNTDYKVSYSNNTEKGKANVTVTGIGNYTRTKTLNFVIAADVAKVDGLPYTMKNTKKYGDWDSTDTIPISVFEKIPAGYSAVITVDYDLRNEESYALLKPIAATDDNWLTINEKYFSGIPRSTDYENESDWRDNEIVMQKDGFIVVTHLRGPVTFYITSEGVADLISGSKDNIGVLFQIYDVDIKSVTVSAARFDDAPSHTHSYTAKVTKAATCTETGIKTYTCSCGDSYTETIPALGHSFSTAWTTDVEPTCTAAGSKSHHCTRCGAKNSITEIPATGHTWDSGKVTKAATCTEDGEKTCTCTKCGATKTEVIKATGHKFVDKTIAPTYDAEGYTEHTCSVCGYSYKDNYTPKKERADISKATVTVASATVYTGKALKPAVTVKLGGKTLMKNTDYSIAYKSNTNCGKATITITGKGGYTGTKTATFIIKPAKATISSIKSPKTKQLKVTWKKSAGGVSGYQVMIATNNKFTKGKKTVTITSAATTSKTFSGLKKGTTYFAKVRAYKTVGKTKYYGTWSAVKSVKTK